MEIQDIKSLLPISTEQQELTQKILTQFGETQLLWLSGYLTGYVNASQQKNLATAPSHSVTETVTSQAPVLDTLAKEVGSSQKISILYGSRTGNSRKAADLLHQKAVSLGIEAKTLDMGDYDPKNLKKETHLFVVVSTHGEGEPPLAAEDFYSFLHSSRAPRLEGLQYAVLALGDKSYAQFCKTGADIDLQLSKLGATRLVERYDCDVDFLPTAEAWTATVLEKLAGEKQTHPVPTSQTTSQAATANDYSRSNPFEAEILEKIQLNGKGADKETYHLELSLAGSGLTYEPGDALGVFPENSDALVNELLQLTKLKGEAPVTIQSTTLSLQEALKHHLEIGTLSRDVIDKHNQQLQNSDLTAILKDPKLLGEFTYGADVVDLLKKYPYSYDAAGLVAILRNLQPRLYSISSAFSAYPDEVHITAGALRYNSHQRDKNGTCSTYLADQLNIGEKLRIFIEKNEAFRLPSDSSAPIIMLGPGTGVAPFRAFTQHRAESGSKGKNWLFFGDRYFTSDFLYQTEWLNYKKKGILTNLSVAFSRDQKQKVYVQHKLKENSREIVRWIDEGAYIYVCGDMKRMARDVLQTFIEVISQEKQVGKEQAREFVQNLRKQKRYQEDVY